MKKLNTSQSSHLKKGEKTLIYPQTGEDKIGFHSCRAFNQVLYLWKVTSNNTVIQYHIQCHIYLSSYHQRHTVIPSF